MQLEGENFKTDGTFSPWAMDEGLEAFFDESQKDGERNLQWERPRVDGCKSYTLDPEWMAVSFSDDGMGIPPENMDKLFEPLFTTKTKGIGLGMERVVGEGFEPPFRKSQTSCLLDDPTLKHSTRCSAFLERVVGEGFEPPFPDPESDVLPIRRSHSKKTKKRGGVNPRALR